MCVLCELGRVFVDYECILPAELEADCAIAELVAKGCQKCYHAPMENKDICLKCHDGKLMEDDDCHDVS